MSLHCDILANEINPDGGLAVKQEGYILFGFESVMGEPFDDGRFADAGVPQQDDLIVLAGVAGRNRTHCIINLRSMQYRISMHIIFDNI